MSNANRDYAIVYDVKNSLLVLSRPLNFYITDKNTSNIFVKLVTRVILGDGIDQYTDIEDASGYVLTMRVIKPDDEVKSLTATQHESESIFQFDLTEDFKDIPGKYICELTISNIVNGRQEFTTSDPFNYEVKRSILSNIKNIIEGKDTTVEKLLNDLEATKAELSSRIQEKMNKDTKDIAINQINKNLGLIDQSYLTEGLKQQIAGNAPINAVPAFGSITQEMMARPYLEAKKSKNLLCPDTVTWGKYVAYHDGNLVDGGTYVVSDYIPVIASQPITLSGNHQQYALFDVNKVYVEGDINDQDPKTIIPSVNGYIRINCNLMENELATTQLELGSEATDYEEYFDICFDINTIKDRIPAEKLDDRLVIGRKSINLFNKNDVIQDCYVYMENGLEITNDYYVSSNYIKVEGGKTYSVLYRGEGTQGAFYDKNKNYISGINIEENANFQAPTNSVYFRFGFPKHVLDLQTLAQADSVDHYEEYGKVYLDVSNCGTDLKKMFLPSGTIIVAKEGGDYNNLQDAIDNAYDTSDNPVTILVYPGVYPSFKLLGPDYAPIRNISIIGIDKHKCIIRDDNGVYTNPPAEIQTTGLIKGLSFISTHDLDSTTNVDNLRSYAVHCDYEVNGVLEFEDCIMISKQNAAFGSGLHKNMTLKLTRCELYSETPVGSSMIQNGALLCHSNLNSSTINQNLIVKDCIIKSKNSYAAYINDVGSGANMKVTFINNMIWSDELKKTNQAIHIDTPVTGISGDITLTEESYGNNISLLNN